MFFVFLALATSARCRPSCLPKLASGEAIGTFAMVEGSGRASADKISASVSGGMLTGTKLPVADGCDADFAVVAAKDEAGGLSLYLVSLTGEGVTRDVLETVDPTRGQAKLTFSGAPAELLGVAGEGWEIASQVLDRAAILMAFEQVGGADKSLEMARDYALERMAFGRQIGSFQAIQHHCANMATDVEGSRYITYQAAWYLSEGMPAENEVAMAKAWVSEAYRRVCALGHQCHGAIGFTKEHNMQLYSRRAKAAELAFGDSDFHLEAVAEAIGL